VSFAFTIQTDPLTDGFFTAMFPWMLAVYGLLSILFLIDKSWVCGSLVSSALLIFVSIQCFHAGDIEVGHGFSIPVIFRMTAALLVWCIAPAAGFVTSRVISALFTRWRSQASHEETILPGSKARSVSADPPEP
jgi:hypothetical protein